MNQNSFPSWDLVQVVDLVLSKSDYHSLTVLESPRHALRTKEEAPRMTAILL